MTQPRREARGLRRAAAPDAHAALRRRVLPAGLGLATGLAVGLGAALTAAPALAHHPLGGLPMETFAHGLLSGLGHPVLGFDHLLFVAVAGIASALAGVRWSGPAAYVALMLAGCLLSVSGLALPAREAVIALSLLAVGGAVARGRPMGPWALPVLAGFGLFHGSAFGEVIAGQEGGAGAGVVIGYLLGLGATQYAVALGAGLAALRLARGEASAPAARIMGAMVAGAGLLLVLEATEGAAFAALGLG